MDAIGLLDERYDTVEDLARARRLPSPKLIGSPERRTLDLETLHVSGVEVSGRLAGISAGTLQLSGSLANLTTSADLKLGRLLDRIDRHVAETDVAAGPIDRPPPTRLPTAVTEVPMARIRTVVWATGNRPHHPWVDPALLDRRGRILHDGGVLDVPGLYVLGMPLTRRRSSTFIHGIRADAEELTDHLVGHLALWAPAA
jgi:putative flavoprotein involved in K+ transport